MKRLLLFSIAALAIGESQANPTYLNFRANGVFVTNTSGNSFSAELGWNPAYQFNNKWSVRGNFGLAPLKGKSKTFLMSEFGVLGAYTINPTWEVEAGAGLQMWSGKSNALMENVNVLWKLPTPFMGLVDKVFAGYSLVNQDISTSMIKAGVTITFGSAEKGVINETK